MTSQATVMRTEDALTCHRQPLTESTRVITLFCAYRMRGKRTSFPTVHTFDLKSRLLFPNQTDVYPDQQSQATRETTIRIRELIL